MAHSLWAQTPCETYFPQAEGEETIMLSYDEKDKFQGYSSMTVLDKSSSEVEMTATHYDKKGKEQGKMDYSIVCDGDRILMDMEFFMPQDMMAGFKDAEVEVSGDPLQVPSKLKVGQELPSGTLTMDIDMGAMKMTMNMEIVERKVVSKETISTSLGDIEAFKIEQTTRTDMGVMKMEHKSEDYWSPGYGNVKNVSYNKNGKMIGYQIIGKRSDVE